MIIDVHCHSSNKPYMTGIPDPDKNIFNEYTFTKSSVLEGLLENITSIQNSTQSNFDKLHKGGVRIAFVSITPAEKAFFQLGRNGIVGLAYRRIINSGLASREKIIKSITGFEKENILYIDEVQKDYYTEAFLDEYQWIISPEKNISNYPVLFPTNKNELLVNLNTNPNALNIILTIEGAHVFGPTPSEIRLQQLEVPFQLTQQEVDTMVENIKDVKRQAVPIFSVGVFHHFWNGLGGHADSLKGIVDKLTNQKAGVNTGLNEHGKRVIRELVKAEGNSKGIIIDIKHMSLLSRRDYYAMRAAEPALRRTPIFCSHTGINSRWKTISTWLAHQDESIKGKCFLHENPINLCGEDIEQIYDSQGLIGLQLDEKRLLGKHAIVEINFERESDNINESDEDYQSYQYAKYFFANIFFAIDYLTRKKGIFNDNYWNIFSIGSDFDGVINHLKNCKDATRLIAFKDTCFAFLTTSEIIPISNFNDQAPVTIDLNRQKILKGNLSNQEIVDKIFEHNAKFFLLNNF